MLSEFEGHGETEDEFAIRCRTNYRDAEEIQSIEDAHMAIVALLRRMNVNSFIELCDECVLWFNQIKHANPALWSLYQEEREQPEDERLVVPFVTAAFLMMLPHALAENLIFVNRRPLDGEAIIEHLTSDAFRIKYGDSTFWDVIRHTTWKAKSGSRYSSEAQVLKDLVENRRTLNYDVGNLSTLHVCDPCASLESDLAQYQLRKQSSSFSYSNDWETETEPQQPDTVVTASSCDNGTIICGPVRLLPDPVHGMIIDLGRIPPIPLGELDRVAIFIRSHSGDGLLELEAGKGSWCMEDAICGSNVAKLFIDGGFVIQRTSKTCSIACYDVSESSTSYELRGPRT